MSDVYGTVATREGGVDRNLMCSFGSFVKRVATREGGVDRNAKRSTWTKTCPAVATREGGVDRN